MRDYIDIVGYGTHRLPKGMMLDHFGVQLDVMGHLLSQSAAWRAEENRVRELARTFFATHLAWSTDMLEVAAARATTEFYRGAVALTRAFLDGENQAALGSGTA